MLGISFSEFMVVLIVGVLFVRPKDLPHIAKILKSAHRQFHKIKSEFMSYYKQFHEEIDCLDDKEEYVVDDNGVPQRSYDISELKEKKRRKSISKKK